MHLKFCKIIYYFIFDNTDYAYNLIFIYYLLFIYYLFINNKMTEHNSRLQRIIDDINMSIYAR